MTARVRVVMNERSGSCAGRRQEIEEAFRQHGVACEVLGLRPKMALPTDGEDGVLVAAGGDGTVNAVATMVAGTGMRMGVLGLGTLNHFAKDMRLPLEVEDAVAVIVKGTPRAVDCGEVNGQLFVNNSSLGFYPGMVVERERMKKGGRNKWLSLTLASVGGFLRFRQLTVHLTLPPCEGKPARRAVRRTPFLFVGNNEYTVAGTSAGSRVSLNGGKLHLALAPGATRWSLFRLSWALLRGRLHEQENFESFCVDEFTVEIRRRVARVSVDGELRRMQGTLHYRVRPGALQVMTLPADGEEGFG